MLTLLLLGVEVLDVGQVGHGDLELPHLFEDVVDLHDDILAAFDVIVEGLVEIVGSSIQEFHEFLGGYLGDGIVGFFCGDVELIVAHEGGPEHRHEVDLIELISEADLINYLRG